MKKNVKITKQSQAFKGYIKILSSFSPELQL